MPNVANEREIDVANADYWLDRHEKLEGDIRSVGNKGLDIPTNEAASENIRQLLRTFLPELIGSRSRATVLDLGCGIGRFAPVFIDLGLDYEGIDLSPVAVRQAKAANPQGRFAVASLLDWEPARTYDIVFIAYVLCHCVSDRAWGAALRAVSRSLRNDGTAIIFDRFEAERRTYSDYVLERSFQEAVAGFADVYLTLASMPMHPNLHVATRGSRK
jgi:SAM-dependent methyltransferase